MSKWLDFLFTIVVRLICGVVLGSGAGMLLNYKGILRSFSKDNLKGPVIWLALCGLVGGVIAIFTVPRWQTPWYKGIRGGNDKGAP